MTHDPEADHPTTDLRPKSRSTSSDSRDQKSSGSGRSTATPSPEPERIGPYEVVRLLGRGGMGRVYLAEQLEPIRRQVAVKVIATEFTNRNAIYRFESERRALARMNHPNVAQVLDAGKTRNGFPFIVMEYVPGQRITKFCDAHQLSLDQRLDLFIDVCQGIQHAHQKGLIHRDIKPSNILVSEVQNRMVPKIIDFGIAKALDEPLSEAQLTADHIVGTPAYLSPESVTAVETGLGLDTRSDVYSLGIVLYELLLGHLPFDASNKSLVQVLRRISEEDVTSPSAKLASLEAETRAQIATARGLKPATLARKLLGELDWITLKATSKERSRRYVSAAELAEDIERYRNDLPVLAGPPGRAYRIGKFVRRNTVGVIAATLVVISLIAGFAARTFEARRANAEALRANQEARAAKQAQLEASEIASFLVDLFEVADPGEARGNSITAREILDKGSRRVEKDLAEQPLAQARLLHIIGVIYRKLGLYGESEHPLETALSLRQDSLEAEHVDIAATLQDVVTLYWLQGRYSEAEPLARTLVDLRRRTLGENHPDLGESTDSLALILRRLGRLDEAEPLFLKALEIREQAHGTDHPKVAESVNGLAILYWNQGRYSDAATQLLRAISIWEHSYGSLHPELAASLNNLAGVYRDQGSFEQAEPLYRRAISIRMQVFGENHPSIGYSASNLALLLRKVGRFEEAEPLFRQSLEVWEATLGGQHPEVAFALNNLALLYYDMDRSAEGEALVARALRINEHVRGPRHSSVAASLNIQALIYRGLDRRAEAQLLHRKAWEIFEENRGPEHTSVGWSLHLLAELLGEDGDLDQAIPLLERALQIRRQGLGDDHPDTMATVELLDSLSRQL